MLPLAVHRDFIDMLFSMRLPILGLGAVFTGVAALAAYALDDPVFTVFALSGALVTVARLIILQAYHAASPVARLAELKRWEARYALGTHTFAALLALLNLHALSYAYPLLHLITVSLVFTFGAGVVSRISVRPMICVPSLLLATVPTVAGLAVHAFAGHPVPLHTGLFAIEALLVAMVTALSLQTVAHLYRTAVAHHTARHDMALLARQDALTGLSNRLLLRERFQAGVAMAERKGRRLAVHFLDLDGFKAINDVHGHPAGDAVLVAVARRLEATVRVEDTVARVGGDEFVVLQTDVSHAGEAEILARRIIRKLGAPYDVDGMPMRISASVGIAMTPDLGFDLERLLTCADIALYRAKAGGKSQAMVCTEEDMADAERATAPECAKTRA